MEKMNDNHPWSESALQPPATPAEPAATFCAGRKEWIYGLLALICGMMLCNFVLYGGFQLGFAIAMCAYILCAAGYLLASGAKLSVYSGLLLGLSLVIAAGFGRSDDGFVKFVMTCFLAVSVNLGLCLMAGQNRRCPDRASSLADAGRTVFTMGYGQLSGGMGGLFRSFKLKGTVAKTLGSVAVGLLILLPVLGIVVSLLVEADAAFESLIDCIPEFQMDETLVTVIVGFCVFCVLYTRAVALIRMKPAEPVVKDRKGINKITMNTALIGLSLVYLLYLVSQLAYFVSGFAGIVPKGYSMAEYARRGFFEMAWLCAINMGLIALAVSLVRKTGEKAPLSTRLLCLFVGLVTLFLVAVASAKMLTYIRGYGLTRLRVMTQLIIIFFGLMAVTVSVSLFVKKPRYMPVLLIGALLLGGSAFWADVDTVVAAYNVHAYQTGRLETVDVYYLWELGSGAVPQIAKLVDDENPDVAKAAQWALNRSGSYWEDFRSWNYADWCARAYVTEARETNQERGHAFPNAMRYLGCTEK